MSIEIEPARQPDVEAMLEASTASARSLYAAEESFLLDVSELERPGVTVFVARIDGEALGMAALVDGGDGLPELKRMFVHDHARRRGLASGLIRAVEELARSTGARAVRLETGTRSRAAIALYEGLGYEHIPPFGQYVGSPSSVCMRKALG